jgi:3-oxoadipate enol-lactonase
MMSMGAAATESRASNGIFFRIAGEGEPLLLLHGLMVNGDMFDPLVELLRTRYRMLIPDLRGHGRSRNVDGPYDVAALASDLDRVLAETGFDRCAVMGYSHGGAVAQQLAHTRPAAVSKLMLGCTYECNASTTRERIEAGIAVALLRLFSPGTLGKLVVHASRRKPTGEIGLTRDQVDWVRSLFATNGSRQMREAARGLVTFDSRPWLRELNVPTLVVGGTHDKAVPRHHFDGLVGGIPVATGHLVDRAGHALVWTHTRELADLMRSRWLP